MGTKVPKTRCAKFALNEISLFGKLCILLVVLLTITAVVTSHSAHSLLSDDDETFDIDQDDSSRIKRLSVLDLENEELLQDELQNTGWLHNIAQRVRRSLGLSTPKTRHNSWRLPAPEDHNKRSARPAKITKKVHSKRQAYLEYEGSGDLPDETTDESMEFWQSQFIIIEPWNEAFANHSSREFKELYQQLEMELRELYQLMHGDDDYIIRTWLLNIMPTNDRYKVYVVVQLQLPVQITNFGDTLLQHISKYQRLSNLGAAIDGEYYFRSVRVSSTTQEIPLVNETNDENNGNNTASEGNAVTNDIDASGYGDIDIEHSWSTTEKIYTNVDLSHCRGDTPFTCSQSGVQICADQECDGRVDCQYGEDELNCPIDGNDNNQQPEWNPNEKVCSDSEFKCDNRCLPLMYRCDGVSQCYDNTDEENCPKPPVPEIIDCRADEFRCQSGECIAASKRCDNVPDCQDRSDENETCQAEQHTREDCTSDQFFCDDECHPISIRCNNYADCLDRSDEQNCPYNSYTTRSPPIYPCPQHTCPNGRCYLESERCDGTRDCDDGADESNCCAADQFRCRNGDCVPEYYQCNGYPECRDGSDEEACSDPVPNGARCSSTQFRCDNGQCINAVARCDGRTDCYDASDENNCYPIQPTVAPHLSLKTYPDSQIIKQSNEVIFRCRDEGPLRAKVKWSRPGGHPLPVGANDANGRLEIPNIRVEDSGNYICEAVGYPRHVPGQQVSVHLTVERWNPIVARPPSACHSTQATCMNGECIDKTQICDGIPHCTDGSDEHSCSHGRKCHPNQFMCRNSKCIDRIWRCDGENDCGDNSDEDSCDATPSGAPCRYDEFQCRSGHCIPKSFQCDDTNDCIDASDEIGCMAPAPIRPPPPRMIIAEGGELNLTCVATGVPVPEIVWRLNWGHVPEKCSSKSFAGTGNLNCPGMEVADSGAYSCEIINSKGTTFVTPDTLVTVEAADRTDVCPAGFFNMLARYREECISCFCFGISKNCRSANLYSYAIQPPISSRRVVNVELSPYNNIVVTELPSSDIINLHHGVQFRASNVVYGARQVPYLALPNDYMGNQLKSYGGFLRYDVNFIGDGATTQTPDVIVTGNGYTLVHRTRAPLTPNTKVEMYVQFVPGPWSKPDGRRATREEIMMVLANVEHILIRLSYIDATEREVELTNIVMDSAGMQDLGLGSASLVEQCSCPLGYVGDSCEACAPGYERQSSGAWLGRCAPILPELCSQGTYGDPRRGIPCRECPCPQTGSNNYANGCQLGPDGEVTCNCNEGYAGRRCEMCAPGYQGNPLIPGMGCTLVPESTCNAEGTYRANPNGSCECKPLVVGARCDQCAPESFHLNSFVYTGCIECFCASLTKQCTSSSWYRDQISSSFGRTRAPHGFDLIRDYETPRPQSVKFEEGDTSLQFSQQSISEPLYWSLPPQFLGNKITAYGGKLNYTLSYNPLPGGLMSRNNAPDVVIKSGEDLTIIHYRKAGVNPSQSSSYAVPIIESAWQRYDGQVVNREHLLMALSKIDAIYIKATYTTSTKDGALTEVSIDIATPNNIGTARAVEVEECRCPPGYLGLSCERCADGYKRVPEAGLYLGVCEPCKCNNHSDQCDAETGVCLNCEHNTEGEFCDRCAPGYVGNASGGTPYDCTPGIEYSPSPQQPEVSYNQSYCAYCNQAGTISCENGYCQCKSNVVGNRCDQCRPGTFDLSETNYEGCKECYCSGKTQNCRSSSLYRQLIPVDFFSNAPIITDENGNMVDDSSHLHFDVEANSYEYNVTAYEPRYWSLRGAVLGNQLMSYGGELLYNLQVESYGVYETGNDVILIGNGMKLLWSRPASEQNNPEYHVRLYENENWQRMDRGYSEVASRHDIMSVLSNLEHILIRATTKRPTTHTVIRDVILESAIEYPTPDGRVATDIEICSCPSGYIGNTCEHCAPLHYRDANSDCQACPCEEEATQSCNINASGYVQCQCKPGFAGDRCQHDETAAYPPAPTTVQPNPEYEYRTQITVSIAPPEITIIPVGGSLTLSCTGRMAWTGIPVLVNWYKLNGQLPQSSEIDSGILRLYDLQLYDSGIYRCQAINNQTAKIFEDEVSITITESSQRTPAQIVDLPPVVAFEEYQPNEINCAVSGNPTPGVTWTRIDGQMSNEVYTEGTRLIFNSPRVTDTGNYRCYASNGVGADQVYTQITVRPAVVGTQPPPREHVFIEPSSFFGETGDSVHLECHPTAGAPLVYEWNKDGYPVYRQRNIIVNGNILEIRESNTRDSGTYTCIGIDQRGRQNYTANVQVNIEDNRNYPSQPTAVPGGSPPTVRISPTVTEVAQGLDFNITCEATGTPYPRIRWTMLHESMSDNVHPVENVLQIKNARIENRGMYVCIAENSAGTGQLSTFLEIDPREHPTVEIHLKDQVLPAGNEGALYCSATGLPEPKIEWRRLDGRPLSTTTKEVSSGYIILENLQVSDSAEYECVASNEVGQASGIATIRIIEPPTIRIEPNEEVLRLREGDHVRITCSATGTPPPSVQWVSDDQAQNRAANLQPYEAVLEIAKVSRLDSKLYKCIAANEADTVEGYIMLDVAPAYDASRGDAPDDGDYDPQPDNSQVPTVYRANAGDKVELSCDLVNPQDLNERVYTNWERVDGQPLPSDVQLDRQTLIIARVDEQHAGRYRCKGYNNSGIIVGEYVAELQLIPVPHITFHPKMPIQVMQNENVNILCDVTGEQPIQVSWHAQNNRPLSPTVRIDGQYLRFYAITPADAGHYYCTASNRYGNATEIAEVLVNRGASYTQQPQSRRYDIDEGQGVSLSCDVSIDSQQGGAIQYNWRREDGQPLPRTAYQNKHVLYLTTVRPEDEGRYVCEPFAVGRTFRPSFAVLSIKPNVPQIRQPWPTSTYRPREQSLKLDQQHSKLNVGQSTEVECYSSDGSYTDVVWERADGSPLPPHIQQIENRLVITAARANDAGHYLCKCRTDAGDLYTTSYELDIEVPPVDSKQPEIVHAVVGEQVNLPCLHDISPTDGISYKWTRLYGQMQPKRDLSNSALSLNLVQANDAGAYVCTVTTPNGETHDYRTTLVVTGIIPQFKQEPLSYMVFPKLADSNVKVNFDITFRPEQANGLLLFNGQNQGSGDYISLSLSNGYPEFRFDFDGKPMIVRAEKPITLHEWHTIHVNRFRRDGYMQIDEQHPIALPTLQQVSRLDLIDDLYIGGVPSWNILPDNAVEEQVGFVGCISRLTLQGTTVDLIKDAKYKEGVSACEPCAESPCKNEGICLESQTEMAYTCMCQTGWTGRNCATAGTQCAPGICGLGSCEDTDFGMECLCPLNRTGDRCQYVEHLNENSIAFRSHGFAAYDPPRASKLHIKMQVRPNSLKDSILLYASESKLPSGDYFAVVLQNEHVELMINMGARLNPVIVRSLNPLPLNKWTEIEISRRLGESVLRVGDEPEQRGKANGLARTLNIKTPLYVGGYDYHSVKVNRDINITDGFNGCIANLNEGKRPIHLIANIKEAGNVQNCGETNEVDESYAPTKTMMPTHDKDSNHVSCDADPCENNGTCVMVNDQVTCNCLIGFTGKHCEEHIMLEYNAKFHGNGYLELNRNQFSELVDQKYSFAAMVFSTSQPDGLLLWWGQNKSVDYSGQDFMALAVVDGIIEYSFRLNGEETVIRNPDKRVDDGKRHIVLIKRTDNTGVLEIDHLLDAGETRPTGTYTMRLPGHVFIGGAPDIEKFTGGRYAKNFDGCVHVVEGETSSIIQIHSAAVSGVNVDNCPQTEEDSDTEPPVV